LKIEDFRLYLDRYDFIVISPFIIQRSNSIVI